MSDTGDGSAPTPEQASGQGERGETTPSRPSMPTPARAMMPQPIEGDDGEIIAAVEPPGSDEIMPTAGSTPFAPEANRPVSPYERIGLDEDTDDVYLLGEAAITHASLEASGAPTPMAGVPLVSSRRDDTGTSFGGDDAPFTPRFEPRAIFTPVSAEDPDPTTPDDATGDEAMTDHEHDDATAALPPAEGEDATTPEHRDGATDDEGAGDAPEKSSSRVSRGTVAGLVALGVVVWAAIGYGLVMLLTPDPIQVEAEVHVSADAVSSIEPTSLTDPTDFLAAMPLTVGTFVLTAADSLDPSEADLPERAAEVHDLTYSDGATTVTVRAIQHYSAETAEAAYTSLSEGGTAMDAIVNASGENVGDSATLEGDPTSIVWRNGTAVFVATGDSDSVTAVFTGFGL